MIKSWSISKLTLYEECPRRFKLEHVDHLCPACFKGEVQGWDDAAACTGCGAKVPVPDAIARGNRLHAGVEAAVLNRGPILPELKGVTKLINLLRNGVKKGIVRTEHSFVFDSAWNSVSQYTKGAWLRAKGDILWLKTPVPELIDWKSGGVDSRKGNTIRVGPKYDDQLELYSLLTLLAFPAVEKVASRLVFFDAPETDNERICDPVKQTAVAKLKKKWEKKIKPLFADKTFAPLPNAKCVWCPFNKAKGGPCPY
jgi:hypothetical protein